MGWNLVLHREEEELAVVAKEQKSFRVVEEELVVDSKEQNFQVEEVKIVIDHSIHHKILHILHTRYSSLVVIEIVNSIHHLVVVAMVHLYQEEELHSHLNQMTKVLSQQVFVVAVVAMVAQHHQIFLVAMVR